MLVSRRTRLAVERHGHVGGASARDILNRFESKCEEILLLTWTSGDPAESPFLQLPHTTYMSKRRPRIHWSGASNRARAKKYPEADDSEVERLRGDLTISDEDFAATNNGWVKAVRIFESPSIVRTRLGGSIIRPLSRVDSKQYLPVLDEALKSRLESTFTQPNWTNNQPRMGVPIWSDDPMRASCFATEGIIAEPPEVGGSH